MIGEIFRAMNTKIADRAAAKLPRWRCLSMISGTSTSIGVRVRHRDIASLTPSAGDEARCGSFGWPYFPLRCLSSEAGGVITTVGRMIAIAGEHNSLEPVVARLPGEVVPARAPTETKPDQSLRPLLAKAGRIVPTKVPDAATAPVADVVVVTVWRGGVPTDYRVLAETPRRLFRPILWRLSPSRPGESMAVLDFAG